VPACPCIERVGRCGIALASGIRLIRFEFVQAFGDKLINKIADDHADDAVFGFFALGKNFYPTGQ
jgi:hypothetical protein